MERSSSGRRALSAASQEKPLAAVLECGAGGEAADRDAGRK